MFLSNFCLNILNNLNKTQFIHLQNKIKNFSQSNTSFTEVKKKSDDNSDEDKYKKNERKVINNYESNHPGLMEFFDHPKNWNEEFVKTGRSWKIDELRIKSNSDLHKLWYVLYKEKNMLLTMKAAYKKENAIMPSEERIYKVEESMENIEKVVKERNKTYWQLEVDRDSTGARPYAFRKDVFGRYRWISCSEHFVPYVVNKGWRNISGEGNDKNVVEFMRKYKEKMGSRRANVLYRQAFEVRQILRRFPNVDIDAVKLKYPKIDVEKQKDLLDQDYGIREIISKSFQKYNR